MPVSLRMKLMKLKRGRTVRKTPSRQVTQAASPSPSPRPVVRTENLVFGYEEQF